MRTVLCYPEVFRADDTWRAPGPIITIEDFANGA
jgi:hypothetical protein